MCAINGFNFRDINLIAKMNLVNAHRGPDATNFFVNDRVTLGHNRLSIIDLSDLSSQPMFSEDKKVVLIFNGEIYNFRELRDELKSDHVFKTNGDTEVIIAAYKKWGYDCLKKFNGIFALALWDDVSGSLFVARDEAGVKPLYYYYDGKNFVFSSEIKSILEFGMERVCNIDAFNHYMRVLYVPEPMTMFKDIYKLPPGSFVVSKDSSFVIRRYSYSGGSSFRMGAYDDVKEELKILVEQSVKRQLISDRPLGVYLSGGIDSSVVLDCVARERKNIDTFSVGFKLDDPLEEEKFNHDFNLAKKTSRFYNTNHHEVSLSVKDVIDNIEKVFWHLDEPISNPTVFAMYKLAGFAKEKVDVVLGGDGGDELFGGYERYRLSLLSSYFRKLPKPLRNLFSYNSKFRKLDTKAGVDRFARFMFQKDDILQQVINPNFLKHETLDFFDNKYFRGENIYDFENLFMSVDRRSWLVDESLMMTDKMSMAKAVEARVPFLDLELVKFANLLPLKYKISLFDGKIILKDAFRDRLPKFLFNEPKRGWFSPAAKWLRNKEFYILTKEVLSSDYNKRTDKLFNYQIIERILEDHRSKKLYNLNILWAIVTFQIWAKVYDVKID